jgi:hypothetical protein
LKVISTERFLYDQRLRVLGGRSSGRKGRSGENRRSFAIEIFVYSNGKIIRQDKNEFASEKPAMQTNN